MSFNQLTDAEAERLALLLEEMGEAIQIIGKIQRHGYESFNPNTGPPDNRALLEKELGDVFHAVERMIWADDLDEDEIGRHQKEKPGRWRKGKS